jgi:hypothetical protein
MRKSFSAKCPFEIMETGCTTKKEMLVRESLYEHTVLFAEGHFD